MRMVTGSRRRTDTSSCRLSAAASRPDADLTLISLLVRCVDSAPMSSREAELSWTLSALSCMPFATAASRFEAEAIFTPPATCRPSRISTVVQPWKIGRLGFEPRRSAATSTASSILTTTPSIEYVVGNVWAVEV